MVYALPFAAQYGWVWRVGITVPFALLTAFFAYNWQDVVNYWHEHNWIVRAMMLYTGAVFPCGVLSTWLTRTTFTKHGIEHRTMFGITKSYLYSELTKVRFHEGKSVEMNFANATKLKVFAATANLEQVLEIIGAHQQGLIDTEIRLQN